MTGRDRQSLAFGRGKPEGVERSSGWCAVGGGEKGEELHRAQNRG